MSYDISKLKSELGGLIHGTNINQITGIDNLIDRAGSQVLLDCDPQETIRITSLTTPVYNSVYDYPLPVDVKGTRIIDIFPQANRKNTQIYQQIYNQYFDVSKGLTTQDRMSVLFNSGVKTIRLDSPDLTYPTTINQCDSLTSQGTWSSPTFTSLTVDNINYISDGTSLKFNLPAAPTGYIENSTMPSVDLSSIEDQGTIFLWTYLPTGASITSLILLWGSDSSNFWQVTATTDHAGNAFADGWNLVKFNWLGATENGNPNSTDINFIRLNYNWNSIAQTAVRLDYIFAVLGTLMNIEYYSKYMFRTTTGTWLESHTSDTDYINLDTESVRSLMLVKVAEFAVQQQQGLNAMFSDGPNFAQQYQQNLSRYTALNKSQVQKPQATYYRVHKGAYPIRPIRRGF